MSLDGELAGPESEFIHQAYEEVPKKEDDDQLADELVEEEIEIGEVEMPTYHAPATPDLPEHDVEYAAKTLESCPHCSRTFLPERLKIHLKSCKADRPLKKRITSTQKRG